MPPEPVSTVATHNIVDTPTMQVDAGGRSFVALKMNITGAALAHYLGRALTGNDPVARGEALGAASRRKQ